VSKTSRWRRIALVALSATAVVLAIALGVRSIREPVLRNVGAALVVADPVAPVDVIVVSADTSGAGALEAADLVSAGIATRVAVFSDPPTGEDLEFVRRGLPYDNRAARQTRQLGWLGVSDVVRIPQAYPGTHGEADVLPRWAQETGVSSIVYVVNPDHSRRARRVLGRSMSGRPTTVIVRPSRYSEFDPQQWWRTRRDVRTVIIEYQKLGLDLLLHPFPG
jgi:hypothetical protein